MNWCVCGQNLSMIKRGFWEYLKCIIYNGMELEMMYLNRMIVFGILFVKFLSMVYICISKHDSFVGWFSK